jgi:hypothetical protein
MPPVRGLELESNSHAARRASCARRKLDLRYAAAVVSLLISGCAIPTSLNGRPVKEKGDVAIGGGLLVPFALAGGAATTFGDGADFETFDDLWVGVGSFDYGIGDGRTAGGMVAVLLPPEGTRGAGVVVTPRVELPIARSEQTGQRWASFVAEVALGYVDLVADDGTFFANVPILNPTGGVRLYVPFGRFGGAVITQQSAIPGASLALPGSAALDLPIPLGRTARLHLMPEFRWDPVFLFAAGEEAGVGTVAAFSAGGSAMLVF